MGSIYPPIPLKLTTYACHGKFLDSPLPTLLVQKINFSAKKLKNLEPSGNIPKLYRKLLAN
jgi:hypothetical protein